jgi:O-antigen ligase
MYFPFSRALAVLAVLVALLVIRSMHKGLRIYYNREMAAGLVMLLGVLVSCFTAISHGDAVFGLLAALASAFWVMLLLQSEADQRKAALGVLPIAGVVMVGICALGYTMPDVRELFFSSGRLQGTFGYANTMALFLLLCLVIYLTGDSGKIKDKKRWQMIVYPIVLIFGIFWTGSRTTALLLVAVLLVFAFQMKEYRKWVISGLAILLAALVAYVAVSGNTDSIGRIFTLSSLSTFWGRLLYWKDALPLLLQHPFGMGTNGYFFINESIQTGVYTVRFVHNDWLQLALDYGVVTFFAFVFLYVLQWKKSRGQNRWILTLIGIHMLMDMDLQYLVILWILLLAMDFHHGKEMVVLETGKPDSSTGKNPLAGGMILTALVITVALSLWLGTADICYMTDQLTAADSIYPWHVETKEYRILQAIEDGDVDETETLALEALALNPYDAAAQDALALVGSTRQDYLYMMEAKQKAVELQPYRAEEYEEFMSFADTALASFQETKDEDAYQACIAMMEDVVQRRITVEKNTSTLAYWIKDAPEFTWSNESQKIMEKYGKK